MKWVTSLFNKDAVKDVGDVATTVAAVGSAAPYVIKGVNLVRVAIATLSLSAVGFGAIVEHEDYIAVARSPVAGDVATLGFGSTGKDIKLGDTTTPPKAVRRALSDIAKFENAIKHCVYVPLAQVEYDVYVSLSYNIGEGAFCNSTLVRKLNEANYIGACTEILRWDKFQGKPLRGLTLRREQEYKKCMSAQ